MARLTITRRYSFRSVHSLPLGEHQEKSHGHQYFLEVTFKDCTVQAVDREVAAHVIAPLDGHDLTRNFTTATGEVLVEWIHTQLERCFHEDGGKIVGVALQETKRNRFISMRSESRVI